MDWNNVASNSKHLVECRRNLFSDELHSLCNYVNQVIKEIGGIRNTHAEMKNFRHFNLKTRKNNSFFSFGLSLHVT